MALVLLLGLALWVAAKGLPAGMFRGAGRAPRYQFSFWGNGILGTMTSQVDIIIAGNYLAPAGLGTYQILKRFANLLSLPQIVANWLVIVTIGRYYAAGDLDAVQGQCRVGLRYSLLPGALLLVLGLVASPWLFDIYAIEANTAHYGAYAVLLAGSLFNILYGVNFTVASQCHLEKHAGYGRLLGMAACVLGILLLRHHLNLVWLASIVLVSQLLSQSYVWLVIRKRLNIDTSVLCLARR